jgi:hypothetical protein
VLTGSSGRDGATGAEYCSTSAWRSAFNPPSRKMDDKNEGSMAINVLESDDHGNVVAKPVIGWSVTTIKGETVLAVIEYADSQSEIKPEGRKIQFDLTLQQSLRLAGGLIDVVNHIREESLKKL